MPVVPFCG